MLVACRLCSANGDWRFDQLYVRFQFEFRVMCVKSCRFLFSSQASEQNSAQRFDLVFHHFSILNGEIYWARARVRNLTTRKNPTQISLTSKFFFMKVECVRASGKERNLNVRLNLQCNCRIDMDFDILLWRAAINTAPLSHCFFIHILSLFSRSLCAHLRVCRCSWFCVSIMRKLFHFGNKPNQIDGTEHLSAMAAAKIVNEMIGWDKIDLQFSIDLRYGLWICRVDVQRFGALLKWFGCFTYHRRMVPVGNYIWCCCHVGRIIRTWRW